MRTPITLGDLLPIAVPGFLVIGALSVLVQPTFVGALAFSGPAIPLLVGLVVGTLVIGYILAGLQGWLSSTWSRWALPPEAHLADRDHGVALPAAAVARAGFTTAGPLVVPLGTAFALERALAGAWGTPEGAGWDRVAFVQRLTLALTASALLAALFLLGAGLLGGVDRGLRDHAGAVLVLGALGAWLVGRAVSRMRKEAVLELFADARALLLDRGENTEVQRVLSDLDVRLIEEDLGIEV